MTIKELKEIIGNLPEETIILTGGAIIDEIESIYIQYHSDGRMHLIFSTLE